MFLVKTQKPNKIWDHELYIDGTIFWNKETLGCIYNATFLIWWGITTNDLSFLESGTKALKKCNIMQDNNQYYGLYFETDLSQNQIDLVTVLACVKCYTKLYELLNNKSLLSRAKKSAWHVISKMWSNVNDSNGNDITGGLLVTTYKNMGFPVIGGSELCQTFEVICELSKHGDDFFVYAKALLGFCSNYLIREGKLLLGIYEIIYGHSEDWVNSYSSDFAAYATGPFIRGLYLFNTLLEKEKK
ncbi:MAG: hypothetical protein GF383_08920 [Candidatus Lokiarchaeota archaeon]|nr:hypothetical protein [Candidatus Lokiarchaeota archaeon]